MTEQASNGSEGQQSSESPDLTLATTGWCVLGLGVIWNLGFLDPTKSGLFAGEAFALSDGVVWALYIVGLVLAAVGHGRARVAAVKIRDAGGADHVAYHRKLAVGATVAGLAYFVGFLVVLGVQVSGVGVSP